MSADFIPPIQCSSSHFILQGVPAPTRNQKLAKH